MERTRPLPPWELSFLVVATTWGASFMFIKVGLEALDPLEVAFGRCALGALTLIVLVAVMREPLPRGREIWGRLFLMAIVFNAAPFAFFSFGEEHVSSVVAGIFNATTPLFTAVLAMSMLPDEGPTPARVIGVLVGFAGTLIVLGPWHGLGGSNLLGSLLCLGAPVCYGIGFVYARKHFFGRGHSLVSLSAAQVSLGTLQLGVVMPFFSSAPSHISLKVAGSMLALGALGTGVAYVLNYDVIERAGATTASLVTYVVPIFATAFGVLLLDEGLSWNLPVGALVIVAGVAVSQGLLRIRRRAAVVP